jgi:hypothetical protein
MAWHPGHSKALLLCFLLFAFAALEDSEPVRLGKRGKAHTALSPGGALC